MYIRNKISFSFIYFSHAFYFIFKDKENTEYAKVLVASADQIQTSVIQKEFTELQDHLASAEVVVLTLKLYILYLMLL